MSVLFADRPLFIDLKCVHETLTQVACHFHRDHWAAVVDDEAYARRGDDKIVIRAYSADRFKDGNIFTLEGYIKSSAHDMFNKYHPSAESRPVPTVVYERIARCARNQIAMAALCKMKIEDMKAAHCYQRGNRFGVVDWLNDHATFGEIDDVTERACQLFEGQILPWPDNVRPVHYTDPAYITPKGE